MFCTSPAPLPDTGHKKRHRFLRFLPIPAVPPVYQGSPSRLCHRETFFHPLPCTYSAKGKSYFPELPFLLRKPPWKKSHSGNLSAPALPFSEVLHPAGGEAISEKSFLSFLFLSRVLEFRISISLQLYITDIKIKNSLPEANCFT